MSGGVDVDSGKRNGELRKYEDVRQVYPLIRDRELDGDEYTICLSSEFLLDPPEIARFLDPVAVLDKVSVFILFSWRLFLGYYKINMVFYYFPFQISF